MMQTRIWKLVGMVALISSFALLVAACDELEAERVDDVTDDTEEIADASDDATDDSEEATNDSDPATDDSDDAGEAADDAADDSAEAAAESDDTPVETEAADDQDLEEAEGFTVGDTVRMGELVMHLHSVRWDEGGEFMSPDEGMRWLVADIEIENEADEPTNISSLMMFDLVDEENRTRDLAIMADTEGSMDGELGAGRSMRGDIAWEVREEQSEWELVFTPQLFGFGQAIFDITADDIQ